MKIAAKKIFAKKKKNFNYCLTFIMIQGTPDKNFTKIKNVEQQKYPLNCIIRNGLTPLQTV